MKFGITIPRFVTPGGDAAIGPELASIARDADQAGLDSLWVMDHFFQIPPVGAGRRADAGRLFSAGLSSPASRSASSSARSSPASPIDIPEF